MGKVALFLQCRELVANRRRTHTQIHLGKRFRADGQCFAHIFFYQECQQHLASFGHPHTSSRNSTKQAVVSPLVEIDFMLKNRLIKICQVS